jgi:hemerythrin-like domain-containing protein
MAFVRQARSYISLLQAHITKEDDCLARVTAANFPDAGERAALAREFVELERREMGDGVFERYAAMLEPLEQRLGAEAQAAAARP